MRQLNIRKISMILLFTGLMAAFSVNQARADVRINIGFGVPLGYYTPSYGVHHYHYHRHHNHYRAPKRHHHYYAPRSYHRAPVVKHKHYYQPRHHHNHKRGHRNHRRW